jgi:hypothetical protein
MTRAPGDLLGLILVWSWSDGRTLTSCWRPQARLTLVCGSSFAIQSRAMALQLFLGFEHGSRTLD